MTLVLFQENDFCLAASQEDYMGFVPMDISVQQVCESQQKRFKAESKPRKISPEIDIYSAVRYVGVQRTS